MTGPDRLIASVELDGQTVDAAMAHFHRRGGSLSTTVQYLPEYQTDRRAYALDPELPLAAGSRSVRGLPGAFSDCAPDRWGKNLITKRLTAEAKRDGRTPPSISDVDLLVGVADETRQGALRFRRPGDAEFLHPEADVPPLVELPRLLRAADHVTFSPTQSVAGLEAIKDLLGAGTGTLGGARPKASVRDGDRLVIAKFPQRDDPVDVMAWECTALDLAEKAGINVPRHRALRVDGRMVLLLDRFDREAGSRRVGYVSGMTMTEHHDGDVADYLDLAAAVVAYGARPREDLAAMWRRIAFSVAIHNTDDHLRNHGFLRSGSGWTLSPVFDVNPDPDPAKERVTGICGARSRDDEVDALLLSAPDFGLTNARAATILREVFEATRAWREVARRYGVSESEAGAFETGFDGLRDQVGQAIGALDAAPASGGRRRRS